MEGDEYGGLLQALQRPINCLTDADRNIRRGGLATLQKELERATKPSQVRMLTSTNLAKNLLFTLADPIEANREATLLLLERLLAGAALKKEDADPLVQGLIHRINNTPFPEKSEDLREKIILLLRASLTFKESVAAHMSELAAALAKCLLDPKAEIKNRASELLNELSAEFRGSVGKYAAAIAKSLAENLKNNKYAVRRNTLVTLSRLLVTEGAGSHFEHLQLPLKLALADPKAEVRRAALEAAAHLLKYMAPKFLKQYEPALVGCLLAGLSDEQEEIVKVSMRLLEECGQSIRELEGEEAIAEESH